MQDLLTVATLFIALTTSTVAAPSASTTTTTTSPTVTNSVDGQGGTPTCDPSKQKC